jgi:hypothetical protein
LVKFKKIVLVIINCCFYIMGGNYFDGIVLV